MYFVKTMGEACFEGENLRRENLRKKNLEEENDTK